MQASNTSYTADATSVGKTVTKSAAGDTVTVSAYQDGLKGTSAMVVLQINSDGKSSATTDPSSGVVTLNASGSGTISYLVLTLGSSDSANWTVYVNTSGGSNYKFVKGTGGGGHS